MTRAPATIRFQATLLRPASPRNATWAFLVVPREASARLPTRAMTTVAGTLSGHSFQATLAPDGEGSHWLKVPQALREAAGVAIGDTVTLEVAPVSVEPEPRLPPDLRKALAAAPAARAKWDGLTTVARRDWIQWLASAKQAATRERRVAATCDMLLAGKRRVCCFDRSGIYGKGMAAPEPAP